MMFRFDDERRADAPRLAAVPTRTCRGDALGELDDLAEELHDTTCGCGAGVGVDRRGCWAWTSGRFHRRAARVQRGRRTEPAPIAA